MSGFPGRGLGISAVAIDASYRELVGMHFLDSRVTTSRLASDALCIRYFLRLIGNVRRNYRFDVCRPSRHRMLRKHRAWISGVIGAIASQVEDSSGQDDTCQQTYSAQPGP